MFKLICRMLSISKVNLYRESVIGAGRQEGIMKDSDFVPKIWPEDQVPSGALKYYNQCEVCTEKSRMIWGEGNPNAPILIILDNPGERVDKEGREYVCGTRQTLQGAIHRVGLDAHDFYLTYLLKCRPLKKYDKERAREFSKPFLFGQIETIDPKFIVCLGDVVIQTVFGDKETSVKSLRGVWRSVMDRPCLVSYHPLAIRRRPNLMGIFMEDWGMLADRFLSENQKPI